MDCKYCGTADVSNDYTCPTCKRKGCENCMATGDSSPCDQCTFHQEDKPAEERMQPTWSID